MTAINPKHLPLYFKVPTHDELASKVDSLSPHDRSSLSGIIYRLAIADGVSIPAWDHRWGKFHTLDSDSRLITAFLQQIKIHLQTQTRCSEKIADLVVQYCPSVDQIALNPETLKDLVLRANYLARLDDLRNQLNRKYPELGLFRAWKSQETFLLTLPVCVLRNESERFDYFTSVVQELVSGKYDAKTAGMILDKLLERESRRPSSPHLESHMRLLDIKKVAKRQIFGSGLNRADESLFKDIFIVPHPDDKQAKFKPLLPGGATKEVHAYHCDRMLGIGMTAPTIMLKTGNLASNIETIRRLFYSAAIAANRKVIVEMVDENHFIPGKDSAGANWLRQKAFSSFMASDIPQEVRNSIFMEMFHLCSNGRDIEELGKLLFFSSPGFETSDKQKECAIQNYMRSQAFKDHQSRFSQQGSLQLWQRDCARAFDYIVKDESGGAKLKTAPKILAHFSALLGILKGSMDCSSGNNLIEFDHLKHELVNFWDMDDEKSMPTNNNWWDLRLWQMGLPQCAQAFDRATLLLFSDPALLGKLKQLQSSPQIPDRAYQAQIERLTRIIDLFGAELRKDKITLTPRELFFTLFGGREHFNFTKKKYNADKTFSSDGIRISAIELFEFQLPEAGRNAWYTENDHEQWIVGQNMAKLYAPELP